jgi:hypothetical protein
MAKYTFKTDSPPPSDEQIGKHKDFVKLRANYTSATQRSKIPLYKNKKAFLALVLIVLLAFLIAEFSKETKKDSPVPGSTKGSSTAP